MKAGDYHFASDSQGQASTAKAVLTYSEYKSSKGSRQGDPLDPPSWPSSNPKVAISYILAGRTYHGYLYNRGHSIGDSLLGAKSYTSEYNFTTGTRSQNVGADQNGGMLKKLRKTIGILIPIPVTPLITKPHLYTREMKQFLVVQ